ncbi:hypothetical protein G6K88_21995 [Agrobacterium rhizogenes]|uniref:hypothetical protein n=1 Tax=Rhizobium rhizogenes TaxID=359 RepID=UPI00157209CC|nr:hypothetical protein [Rhizobium rhizogenes]NTH66577.1 hypothetical protein [Rhizobium rhizogenes]NTI04699.1 hypothetical protein [Rhizobium rhizogenes]NTI11508.1 hypothetical protein [Rhizobium rhizogenes]
MKQFYLLGMMALLATPAVADTIADMKSCQGEADSLKRLTCYDAIKIDDENTPADSQTFAVLPKEDEAKSNSPITAAKVRLEIRQKDFRRQILNDQIILVPTLRNGTKKTLVAVELNMTISDAFGEKIVDQIARLDIKIAPGKTVESDSIFYWKNNPFISDEIYDKLIGPVSTGVAKASLDVKRAVFSDGTTESYL